MSDQAGSAVPDLDPDNFPANLRSTVGQVRRRIPGLLPIVERGYYELALDPPAREEVA